RAKVPYSLKSRGSLVVVGGDPWTLKRPRRGGGFGRPVVYLDDSSGAILRLDDPGHGKTGDIILSLQFPLHSGQIAGLAGRIAVSALGCGVAMLSVAGVLIRALKRRARAG